MSISPRRCKRRVIAVLAVAGISVAVGACGSSSSSSKPASGNNGSKTIAMLAGLSNPFQNDIRRGVAGVASAHGYTLHYFNYNNNSATEASDVTDIITSKPALVLYGVSNSSTSLGNFRRLQQAGIPIVCFDVCLSPGQQEKYAHGLVTSNNQTIGQVTGTVAAKYIKTNLGGHAVVAYITCNIESVCQQRFAAQQQALKGVTLTPVGNQAVIDPGQVVSTAESIITAHPNLQMFITDGLSETEGVVAAINSRKAHVAAVGMDITPLIAHDLLAPGGPLQAAVGQDGVKIGQLAANLGFQVLAGKAPKKFVNITVPGKLYQRSDPAAVNAYLATQK